MSNCNCANEGGFVKGRRSYLLQSINTLKLIGDHLGCDSDEVTPLPFTGAPLVKVMIPPAHDYNIQEVNIASLIVMNSVNGW